MEELLPDVLFAAKQGDEEIGDQGAAAVEVEELRPAHDVASDTVERGQARERVRADLVSAPGNPGDVTAGPPLGRRTQRAKHGPAA
jgi:hypothetical protein